MVVCHFLVTEEVMGLIGKDNCEKIYNYFSEKLNNDYGVFGLMGNLQAESGLNPINLQNSFNKKWNITDEQYTKAVDSRKDGNYVLPNGSTQSFIKDSAGYGLAQWTYYTRKQKLYDFVKKRGKSIGDLETQLDFLYVELTVNYMGVWKQLMSANSVLQASNTVLINFEKPKDQSDSVKKYRSQLGLEIKKFIESSKPKFFGVGTELTLSCDVHLRSGDTKETNSLGVMKTGTNVVVLGHSDRTGWYRVYHQELNKTGWCTYKYFK